MSNAKKILIVDDEPHILRSLGFVLERAGYDVLQARSGTEALELIRQEHPVLVFLDIMMPELDGYEVCRTIKSSDDLASTYVIMLTAKGQQHDREEGLEAGADEYMTKPFSPSRAVERVHALLQEPD
ncbi:MAG: response regulator [Candidatus Brocadiae bacterium]|nr:response regulator [Candidatus Brocadiia bacterium]